MTGAQDLDGPPPDGAHPGVTYQDGADPDHSEALRRALAEERARIGRDLHDSVIQDLYAIGLLLAGALERSDPGVVDRIRLAMNELDAAVHRMRAIVAAVGEPDPATPVLELLAGVAAGRIEQLGFVPDILVSHPWMRLPGEVLAELVQFVSEALSNVARHAGATMAQVRLDLDPGGGWSLAVRDDGRGFDPSRAGAGLGMASLRRRAELLAAQFEVTSSPGGGTTVRIHRSGSTDRGPGRTREPRTDP